MLPVVGKGPAFRFPPDRKTEGYTISEVLVVVAIIGLLAALAVPSYFGLRKKAVATEARANLHQLHKLQFAYHAEYGAYTDDMNALGFLETADLTYDYEVAGVWPRGYSATAAANIDGDPPLDVWTVDHTGVIRHLRRD